MTKRNILRKVNQTGSMMIEALAMLTLISLVTPTLYKKSAERTAELQDINTATHVRTLIKAADNYTSVNYQNLLANELKEPGTSFPITQEAISEYLPYGFKIEPTKNFDKPIITIQREGETQTLTSFVFLPKIGDINDLRASRIAAMVGANGGYVAKGGETKGVNGIWGLSDDETNALTNGGAPHASIAAVSTESINAASRSGLEDPKYLQRIPAEPGQEWKNMMASDLYMGGYRDPLLGDEEIPFKSILGVNKMIIGNLNTNDDPIPEKETAALLVRRHRDGAHDGSAFIEGSLNALDGDFSVTKNDENNPELNFANIVTASNNQFGVDLDGDGNPDFDISAGDTGNQSTFNTDTTVAGDHTFTTEGNTNLSTTEGSEFKVGPDGSIIDSDENHINILGDNIEISKNDDNTSNTNINSNTVNIAGKTTIDNPNDEFNNDTPNRTDLNFNLEVQGNTYVSNVLEAGEIDTEKLDSLELHAGGVDYETDEHGNYRRWLHATGEGVEIKELEGDQTQRMLIGPDPKDNNRDKSALYGPTRTDGEGITTQGGLVITNSETSLYAPDSARIYTQNVDGDVYIQGGAIEAIDHPANPDGNKVNIHATETNIGGSDTPEDNTAFSVRPGQAATGTRTRSHVIADADQFMVKKTSPRGSAYDPDDASSQKLLNVVSGQNGAVLDGTATAELDPDKFRIWNQPWSTSNSGEALRILEVDSSTDLENEHGDLQSGASVYIRRGAIELEGSAPVENTAYRADEGLGYIEASRLVANNLDADENRIVPVYAGDYDSGSYDSHDRPDRYMVNPAYTSVMHDIKLTTRGGARLSDILPDFINKGIYIVNNTFKDGINFNDLHVSSNSGRIKASEEESTNSINDWASPYMGMIPAPQCPPGHARVITITPASFQMAQTGDMVFKDGRYYVKEEAKANELGDLNTNTLPTNGEVTGATMQSPHQIVSYDAIGNPTVNYIYYLGLGNESSIKDKHGNSYSPKPLYFQQSTWLKSKVVAYGSNGICSGNPTGEGCGANFLGWAAVMGFVYPETLYGTVISALTGANIANDESSVSNSRVYWNVFPVRARSMEAYATVYCYFDRTNIFNSGNNPQYVDQYDQMKNFRRVYQKDGAGTYNGDTPGNNSNYIERLNDPHLRYKDPW